MSLMTLLKRCTKCGEEKPAEQAFYADRSKGEGFCLPSIHGKNPPGLGVTVGGGGGGRPGSGRRRKLSEPSVRPKPRLRDDAASRRIKERQWNRQYGITRADYQRMFEEQGGVCAICGRQETATRKGTLRHLAVDHCHKTNAVRGLLCHVCNSGIGYFRDDAALIRRALSYLERIA